MMPSLGRESGKLFSVVILVWLTTMSNSDDRVPLSLQTLSCFSSKKVFKLVVKPNSNVVAGLLRLVIKWKRVVILPACLWWLWRHFGCKDTCYEN